MGLDTAQDPGSEHERAPINFAVMMHLEGETSFNPSFYQQYNTKLQEAIDLYSDYGAKITVESELSYINAADTYGNGLLSYALQHGHGVGSHCDMSSNINSYTEEVSEYTTRKNAIDQVVGSSNNLGCSGGWSKTNWAQAAFEAGFSYLSAPVMLSYLAVPYAHRPINSQTGQPYTDDEINNVYYHDPVPIDSSDRFYPRMLKDTQDLDDDGEGIVLLTGSLGEISSLYEGRKNCFPNCTLSEDDTDYIISEIKNFYNSKDESKHSLIYIHFPHSTIKSDADLEIIETWLGKMQELQDQGIIEWKTMKESYEEYKNF